MGENNGKELPYKWEFYKKSFKDIKGSEIGELKGNISESVSNAIETTGLPKYTFNGREVEVLEGRYNCMNATKEAGKRRLNLSNLEELQALREDYTEEFPDWKEDLGKKTFKNPLGFDDDEYLSNTENLSNHVRVINMLTGDTSNVLKSKNCRVVCIHDEGERIHFASNSCKKNQASAITI